MSAKRKVLASPAGKARQNTSVAKVVDEKEDKVDENALDDANISDDEEGGMRIGDIYIPPPIPAHCSMESKGPRLIIWQIVNYNFKSYAGKVTLGPFHHCFTSIIGPNGSGKSNVIDSMLFVFGYRANKIRCKKLSTLLHNSAKFPNMKKCSVAVYFRQIIDRPDGSCEDVPNSEIIVERSAFHDNSSFYTINGRKVQFKEVAKLLKQHHVDLDHNRFLILQGEVESIAMMKPKGQTENESGMLEYLEDIVGTSRYKKPLMDINDRVDQLTEERTDRHNRCKLSEREMKDLEQPYNDAVDFLRKENEQVRTQNLQIQKYLLDTREKVAKYTKEHEEAAETLQQHDDEMKKLKSECKEKEKLRQEELSKNDDLRRKRDEMQKKYEESSSNFAEVQQTMTKVNKRRKQNKANVEKREAELVELHKVPDKNHAEIEECKKKVTKLQGERDELQEQLQRNYAELEDMQKPLIEKREKIETQLVKAKSEVDADKEQLGVAESDLKILKHEETTEVRKYESMKTSYEDSQQSLKEQQDKLQEYTEQLPQIDREIDEKTKAYGKLKQEEPAMTKKMIRMREEVNEKLRNMQSIRSNNRVLDFLMRQKAEGKIPGILGRLGDLGAIDQKYDVAISTAAGGRLDNILVDTVDTAQECINQLKRFDVGRGSFIALEKVAYLANHSGRIQTPENVPRLYDLIRVEDERVLPAFYFSLRNTLVAQDLDQGSRIAYGARRYRVVTLSGNLIEISGAMSGGGNTQLRGKMGTKVATKTQQSADSSQLSQKALEDMQVQADELQSQINFNQQEQGRLEREIRSLQQRKQQIESETQRFNITMKSLKEQLPMIFKQLEKQKKRMQETTTDPQKLAKLEQQIEEKRQKLKVSEEAAAKVSAKIAEVQKQIDDLRGDKVKAVQTRINNVANQIKKLEVNITKLTVEVTGSERQAAKIEKEIKNMRDEIEKMENELKQLSEERSKYDQETLEWSKKLEEANATLNETSTDTSEIEKEIAELKKQQNDNTLKRVELEQQIQAAAAKLNEVKSKIPYWTEKLKPLKLNDIPGEKEPEPPLKTYTDEELATYTLSDIQYKNTVLQEALRNKPNLSCIQDYIEKRDIYLERVKALEDITTKRNEMRQIYDDVRKRRYNEFMTGFSVITRKLKEMYQMITQGGDAELELVDSMDPFTEGVSFSVRPPKKTWKNISNLSGGEKTLSSLALVFALHYYKPSPLYFMDEIDAALDFKNISIVAHYIKERTKNAQFIIISLRSNMFELSDYVVGIYKLNDCTDSITIKNCPPVAELENVQNQCREQSKAQNAAGQRADASLMVDGAERTIRQTQSGESGSGGGRDTTFAPTVESTALSQKIQMELSSSQLSQANTTTGGVAPDVFKKPATPETTS